MDTTLRKSAVHPDSGRRRRLFVELRSHLCVPGAAFAGAFTVPAYVLQSLPAAKVGFQGRGLLKGVTLFTALGR